MSVQGTFSRPMGVSNEQSTSPVRPLLEPLEPRVLLSAMPTSEQAIDLVSFDGADVVMPTGLEQVQTLSDSTWYEFPRWTQPNPQDGYPDSFGKSVDISGEWAIVGWPDCDTGGPGGQSAGGAYIYRYSGDTWAPFQFLRPDEVGGGDQFGESVSLDGTCAVIGAPGDVDSAYTPGSAYIYEFNGSAWEQVKTLRPSSTVGDNVGSAVDVFDERVIVGAPLHTPLYTPEPAVRSGAAFVYKKALDGSWGGGTRLLPGGTLHARDEIGSSVSVTYDWFDQGYKFLIGAPYDDEAGSDAGAVYQAMWQLMLGRYAFRKILPWDAAAGDQFGEAVEIEKSGFVTHAIVGAPGSDHVAVDAGCVYTLVSPTNSWELGPGLKIAFADLGPGDHFGSSVSTEPLHGAGGGAGGQIARHIVGAPNNWVGEPGAAYIFEDDGATVTPVAKIWSGGASPPVFADFGQSVALASDPAYGWQALVGSPQFSSAGNKTGAASCFRVAQRPVADPGGPNVFLLGFDVTLDGSGSYDPDEIHGESIVSYEWDLDEDGQYDDAAGPNPVIPWASIVGLGLDYPADPVTGLPDNTIRLRVTDSLGKTGSASTTLTIYDPAVIDLVVDTLEDQDDDYQELSLREALYVASVRPGNDVITFDPALADGTIELMHGQLEIDSDVEIRGPDGAPITIDAGRSSRGLMVHSGAIVSIRDMRVTDCMAVGSGGGIRNDGTLTLTDMTIAENHATGYGGGIYSEGKVTLSRTTLFGNMATDGGGLAVDVGVLNQASNVTISSNYASGVGGGLYVPGGSITVLNATITGNWARTDGGGIDVGLGTVRLYNTIVADNLVGTVEPTVRNDLHGKVWVGRVDPSSYNLIGWGDGGNLVDGVNGNQVGGLGSPWLDPRLGPLGDNGGPTPTHLPRAFSTAIDRGSNAPVPIKATDQRGRLRKVDGDSNGSVIVDIGAVEVQLGQIRGSKWSDEDGDGVWDEGEPPLRDFQVYLDLNGNNLLDDDPYEPRTVTNSNGEYSFRNLASGDYLVAEVVPTGWYQTFPGQPLVGVDFDHPANYSPDNWTKYEGGPGATLSNLVNEAGITTTFDLTVSTSGSQMTTYGAPIDPNTLPVHTQSLGGVSGYAFESGSPTWTLSWTGLGRYQGCHVFVFGLHSLGANHVTVTRGLGLPPTSFDQTLRGDDLAVNDETGRSDRALGSFAVHSVASATGAVYITVTPAPGQSFCALAGVAIRPLGAGQYPVTVGWEEVVEGVDFGNKDLTAPKVVDVLVAGGGWDQGYLDFLAAEGLGVGGYSIPVGSPDQFDELPWVNVDQIKVVFNEDVDVEQGDLGVYGVDVPEYATSGFAYDSNTFTATWTLGGAFEADKLLLVLDDAVKDGAGNALDGEWTDEVSTYPSGDGAAGGDFRFRFNAVPGDVDQSGEVRSSDTIKVRRKSNTVTGDPDYSVFYDVDGNGEIRASDTIKVRRLSNTELPDGEPTIPPAAPLGGRGGDDELIAAALKAARRTTDRDLLSPLRADVLSLAEIVPLAI